MNHWDSKQIARNGNQITTEIHGKHVNYLGANDVWSPIDCLIVDNGTSFEVKDAPFECEFPYLSTGVATFTSTCRWDIWKKEKITAQPFGMSLEAMDAVSVQGEIFDINDDGRLDAVIYRQAFPQWDADLIYYAQHGRAPRLQKLIRFNSALITAIAPQFRIEYSHASEISTRNVPDGLTRAQHRVNCHARLNTPQPVAQDGGYYVRKDAEPQKRGIGIKPIKFWDSNTLSLHGRKEVVINADLRKQGQGFILTKYITPDLFDGAIFPCYADATSTFYPDPHPETTTVDGHISRSTGYDTWSNMRGGVGTNAQSESTTTTDYIWRRASDSYYSLIARRVALFDASVIGSDSIDSATFSAYHTSATNDGLGGSNELSRVVMGSVSIASNTDLVPADYNIANHGTTDFGRGDKQVDLTLNAYNAIALNASGLAHISGVTPFSLRFGWDFDDDTTGLTGNGGQIVAFSTADEAGTSQDPKLVVVHSAAFNPAWARKRNKIIGAN